MRTRLNYFFKSGRILTIRDSLINTECIVGIFHSKDSAMEFPSIHLVNGHSIPLTEEEYRKLMRFIDEHEHRS